MSSKKRRYVLFLQGSSGFGGSKYSLLNMIDALRGTGYQAVVACPERGWLTGQLDRLDTPYVLVPFYAWRKWLERPRVSPSIRKRWLPALVPWRFDIVQSNEFWWAPHAIQVAKHLKIPVAVHLCDGHHTLKKAYQYHLEKADAALAVSSELRAQFAASPQLYEKTLLLFDGHKEMVFPGDRRKARERFNIRPEEFAVGNVGRLSERKNQRLLLRAMAQLKQQRRLDPFKIFFAGDADPAYADLMAQDVQNLGLQGQVEFLGIVNDMSAFFCATDLVVHCARREGLSRVVPEAMLARKVVVTVSSEGMRDAIPDNRFGCVVPVDDVGELENQIEHLLKSPIHRESITKQAYDRARSLFSMDAHRNNVVSLYDNLISRGSPTSD